MARASTSAAKPAPSSDPSRPVRVVDEFVLHGEPLGFRALCEQLLTKRTRYLVLDLDRTVFLGVNLGELLGWELCAYQAYGGDDALDRLEPQRSGSRLALDWAHPRAIANYLAAGARLWAYPGSYYLLWGKLAYRLDFLRRRAYQRFIDEPFKKAQRIPQLALMHHLESTPEATLRALARRIWERHADRRVIDRDDIDWLRVHYPKLRVVLTSASPKPTVEAAGQALGIDLLGYSTLSRINSGEAKIDLLRSLCPELADPAKARATEIVGISDTGYGEDHCWASHFTRVADINSDAPFPVVVPADAPLSAVHSATLLTRQERAVREAGDAAYLDPHRKAPPAPRTYRLGRAQLEIVLGDLLPQIAEVTTEREGAP